MNKVDTPKRGRPLLPAKHRKSIMLCTRTDESTYRDVRRAAKATGVPIADWMRTRLSQAARRDLRM